MSDGLILPEREHWPAAFADGATARPCFDITAATDNPTPTIVAGMNQRYAVLTFPDGQLSYARKTFKLPEDVYLPGGLTARLLWSTPAIVGNVEWSIETAFVDTDDDLDPAFSLPTDVIAPAGAVADTLQRSEVALDLTGAVAGALLLLRIGRDATDSDDILADDVNLIGVELDYQRRLVLP